MKLTDYFKAFRVASKCMGFSANTRSLYYALLELFDENYYPAELYIKNVYLQARSGITSTSSFDRARDMLINNKLITCHKQTYGLKLDGNSVEREQKGDGKVLESRLSPINNKKNNTNTNTDTTKTPPTAGVRVSDEVLKAWADANGIRLKGDYALKMAEYEQRLGIQKLLALIKKAGSNNSRECISLQYLEAYIFNELKEKKRAELSEDYGAIDEVPT